MKENHKTILTANDPSASEGLKLIQVNDGLVVIDTKSKIMNEDWFNNNDMIAHAHSNVKEEWETDEFVHGISKITNVSYSFEKEKCHKIIFATANLNLEGVAVIEAKEQEILIPFPDTKYRDGSEIKTWMNGWEKGYIQAQQDLFTEEQVREAFNAARRFRMKNVFEFDHAGEIIQSLKQPKVEITFEDGKPVKAVML